MQSYTLIIAFILFSSCTQAQEKAKYINKEGKFKIGFPTTPTITLKDTTEFGSIFPTTSFVAKSLNENNLEYKVHYFDLPNVITDTLVKDNIYILFNELQEKNAIKANDLGYKNFKLLGYIGREYSWKHKKDEILFRTRLYLVKNRIYVIYVSTAQNNNFNNDINKFLNSFELLDTPKNPKAEVETETNNDLEAQNFTIHFPKTPESKEAETTSEEFGTAKMIIYVFQPKLVNDKNLAYMALVTKCQKDITKSKNFNLENFYNQSAEKSANGRQATVISKKMIKIKGRDAIESRESFRNGQIVIKQRMILRGNNIYSVSVMTTPENDENKEMNNFLDSFSLKD